MLAGHGGQYDFIQRRRAPLGAARRHKVDSGRRPTLGPERRQQLASDNNLFLSLARKALKARMTIKRARADVAEQKSELKFEGPDKSDIAGAFRRMEIRTFLREMKGEEQSKYFAQYGDNLPTEIAQAVTELPAEYSGVPQSRHELLIQHALAALHGPAITEIAELEEAIAAAEKRGRDWTR